MEIFLLLLDIIGVIGGIFAIRDWSYRNPGHGTKNAYILSSGEPVNKSKFKRIIHRLFLRRWERDGDEWEYAAGDRVPATGSWADRYTGNKRVALKKGDIFPDNTKIENKYKDESYKESIWFFVTKL